MEISPRYDNSHEKEKCRRMQMDKMETCISDAGVSCPFKALLWPTACASASGFTSLLKLKALCCGTNLSASLKITSLNVYCLGVPRKYFREISCITATMGAFGDAPRPILMSLFAQQWRVTIWRCCLGNYSPAGWASWPWPYPRRSKTSRQAHGDLWRYF